MQHSRAVAVVALLAALAVFGMPGMVSLASTPYALSGPHTWLAALYLAVSALASLALAGRICAGLEHSRARLPAATILFVLAWAAAIALPFVALVLAFGLLGPFGVGSQWLLFNKYLGFIVQSAFGGYSWLLWLGLFVVAPSVLVATEGRAHSQASPA